MFFILFGQLSLKLTKRNSVKLCDTFGSEPDLEMCVKNLGRGSSARIWDQKLPFLDGFSTTLPLNHEYLREET